MKVVCEKEELLKGLQTVCPIVPSRSTLPVLSNFLFETEGNKVKVSSTDLEIAVQCYIKCEVIDDGGITIPAKRFTDIVKELSNGSEIEVKADETNQIDIKSNKSRFNLMGISKIEYPVIPEFPKENNFAIMKDLLASILRKTVFSASKDSQRYILNGVCFIVDDTRFRVVATDGRRLAYIGTDAIKTTVKGKSIVPTKAILDILRLLSTDVKDDVVKIGITDNQIAVRIDETTFLSTLIDGNFPNYEQVIPKTSDFIVKLNVKDTLAAVKQMSLLTGDKISSDRSMSVKFCFVKDFLKISASTAGLGSGEVELEIDYNNEPVEINFNPNFIKEILQNIDESFAMFMFNNGLNPTLIVPEKDKNYLCVVMPMRV